MGDVIHKGQKSDAVKGLQERLVRLGWDLKPDGVFGEATDAAVRELQTLFGYTVDGKVGDGTNGLIEAQIGYAWNLKAPDAKARALAAQGKTAAPSASAPPVKK